MVYKLEGEDLKEYLDAIETFSDRLSKIFFKGLRGIIEDPGAEVPVTLDSILTAIDGDLMNNVSPKILAKIDRMLAEDTDLNAKNKAIKLAFDNMTEAEKQKAVSNFYVKQNEALNKIYGKTDEKKSAVDELSDIFGSKIDPKMMN